MSDRAADTTTLLADVRAGLLDFDGHDGRQARVLRHNIANASLDALAAALTAQAREIALLEETATTLGKQWTASAERERQLREALELCDADDVRLNGCSCTFAGRCYLHAVIVADALAASPEGQTG